MLITLSISQMSLPLHFMKMTEDARTPVRGTTGSAGLDLFSTKSMTVKIKESISIPTGIMVEIPTGHFGEIRDRSSMALQGWHILGGVIDSDYRGELFVIMTNLSKSDKQIDKGAKIAQLIVAPLTDCFLTEITQISETERGAGGFGSTGV